MSNHDQPGSEDKRDMDAVSRAYRDARDRDADHMAPPAALDDAIRAAARRAVHARPQPVGKSWLRQWTPQLAVAAVVVLSVSVVFVAIEEKPELAPAPIQKMTQARRADAPAAAPAATIAPQEARVAETTPPVVMAADAVKKKSGVASGAGADAGTDTGAITANVQGSRQQNSERAKEERSTTPGATPLPPQQAIAAPASLAPAAPVYSPPSPAVASVAPAPFPATDAIAPGRKESRADANLAAAKESKVLAEKVRVAGAIRSAEDVSVPARPVIAGGVATSPVPTAPAALAPEPMMKQLAPSLAAAGAAPPRAALPDRARSETQTSSATGLRGNTTQTYQQSRKSDESENPGPWLKRLLELREQGKLKELREELVRFRKAHPNVVLPKALTELPTE